ncbi:glycosyltransferase family 4 protein [Pontibacter cellulosilyticus]|uniref:Glycosyltransferase family 4 protein n=1 Tax=Pontibacter cellulosilyticus TaxID=1720253 RepID=A0A923NAY6_9BACT|nr:glycosyltransferase family 4 protein [Pontibacter cellulosilyticus]MBC5995067.1 glycosyltransferase family 4 protein [Pontibacter cellulosilyticus]
MKIAYLHQYFALPSSSGGTRSYDLAKSFLNKGHRVVVVTTSSFLKNYKEFSDGWTVLDYEGLELHVLKLDYSNNLSFAKRIITFIQFLVKASLRLIKLKCDVVLATSTPITIAIPAFIKKLVHKTPFIFEVRDVWPEVPIAMGIIKNNTVARLLKGFERMIYQQSSHIVALSDDMEKSISTITKIGKSLSVIPNISEVNRFANCDPNKKLIADLIGEQPKKLVLYAGTIGMVNGLKYMVDIAIHLKEVDPEIKFVVFGDGMEKKELVRYAKKEGVLNKTLFFLDPVSKSQLPQIYYESSVASSFVIPIPELWANSANKFFDCLAAGRPIVINHRGWQADVIERENIGFVLDFNIENIKNEAKRFSDYINNSSLLSMQGKNAKHLAETRYSLEIASVKYLKILDNVVS